MPRRGRKSHSPAWRRVPRRSILPVCPLTIDPSREIRGGSGERRTQNLIRILHRTPIISRRSPTPTFLSAGALPGFVPCPGSCPASCRIDSELDGRSATRPDGLARPQRERGRAVETTGEHAGIRRERRGAGMENSTPGPIGRPPVYVSNKLILGDLLIRWRVRSPSRSPFVKRGIGIRFRSSARRTVDCRCAAAFILRVWVGSDGLDARINTSSINGNQALFLNRSRVPSG